MKKLFILFFLFWCGAARAELVWQSCAGGEAYSSSPQGACSAIAGKRGLPYHHATQSGYSYLCYSTTGSFGAVCQFNMSECPAGTERSVTDGTCKPKPTSCDTDSVPGPNGTCVPKPSTCDVPAGSSVTWTQSEGHSTKPGAELPDGPTLPLPTASPKCGISGLPDIDRCYSTPASDGGKDFFCTYTAKSNGQSSPTGTPTGVTPPTSGTSPTKVPPKSGDSSGKCPGGTTAAGVDSSGIPICVGTGTNPTGADGGSPSDAKPGKSVTVKASDGAGGTVEVTETTTKNDDGSETVKRRTVKTDAGGNSTSDETTRTGLTPGGKQGQPDKPDSDLCKQHPDLNICRNSSVAGTCGQISCMGDAIQCATLRAAATMQCAQEQDVKDVKAMPAKSLGDSILAGADPMKGQIDAAIKGTDVDLSNASLDQSGFLGGGACIGDKSFSVLGHSVSVSFARVCRDIQPLRAVIMACAFIVAYLIVAKSVLQS